MSESRRSSLDLRETEKKEIERRTAIGAIVVHEAIGQDELRRHPAALAWSGLAVGLSMGFSFVAAGLMPAFLPDATWQPLVSNLGYTVGFLIVVLGSPPE
jgi:formate/nitrite transporter FocA (FNT family)